MALDFDISEDLLVCDGLDTVTLKVTGETDVELSECVLTEPIETKEMEPAYGQVPQMDQLFVWPISQSDKPPLGAKIVDEDDTYWTILTVVRKQHVECWEARCRNLNIVTAATNVATIYKATYTHGDAGEAKATWKGLYSGQTTPTAQDTIPARFQPVSEDAAIEFGAEWTREAHKVYFLQPLPQELAGGEFRLVNSAGERFRVIRYFQEQRIDTLPVALAVKITEGSEYVA